MNYHLLSPYIRKASPSCLPKGFRLAKRIIYDYEIIYVREGSALLDIGGTQYICRKNDVVFLRPGVSHILSHYKGANFDQPHIHFDLVYNSNSEITPICFMDRPAMNDNQLALIQEDILDEYIPYVFTPYDKEAFDNLFFDIISLFGERAERYELAVKSKMLELLSLIFRQFDVKGAPEASTVQEPTVMVKNYIDSNFLENITLGSLEKHFFMSKYTLIRNFNRLYNESPMAYYYWLRIEYAKKMLTQTDYPIQTISEKMNLPDGYSFSRFFRTHTGVSPSEYRKVKSEIK